MVQDDYFPMQAPVPHLLAGICHSIVRNSFPPIYKGVNLYLYMHIYLLMIFTSIND